jgi:hypothetical protein
MNKYIKEKGIIKLINEYKESIITEIFNTLVKIKNNLYFNKNKTGPIFDKQNINNIIIYIMTSNSFTILKCRLNDVRAYVKIFNDEDREEHTYYLHSFSDRNCDQWITANKNNKNIKKFTMTFSNNELCSMFEQYNIISYNIKLEIYGSTKYFSYQDNFKIYVNQNNLMYDIEDIIPNKSKRSIKTDYHLVGGSVVIYINVHNLEKLK